MNWPLSDAGRVEQGGALTASSTLTVITASSTTHTKGSWAELLATTGFDATGLLLCLGDGVNASAVDSSALVDVSVGAAGSEQVLVANIPIGGYGPSSASWQLPITVPKGARIAARMQSAVASDAMSLQVYPFGGGMIGREGYGRATTYGANTATSSAVAPSTVTATHAKGAWTQITASTTNPMRALMVAAAGPVTTIYAGATGLLDIGIGASGSEQVIVSNLIFETNTSEIFRIPPFTVPVDIPAATRLSCRYQSASTAAGAKPSVAVIGFD